MHAVDARALRKDERVSGQKRPKVDDPVVGLYGVAQPAALQGRPAENGGKVVFEDTYVLYLAKKPQNL